MARSRKDSYDSDDRRERKRRRSSRRRDDSDSESESDDSRSSADMRRDRKRGSKKDLKKEDSSRKRSKRSRRDRNSEDSDDSEDSRRRRSKKSSRRSSSPSSKKTKKHRKHKKSRKHKRDRDGDEEYMSEASEGVDERSKQLVQMLGYSNEDNPFGDNELTKQFVWKKKNQLEEREKRKKSSSRHKSSSSKDRKQGKKSRRRGDSDSDSRSGSSSDSSIGSSASRRRGDDVDKSLRRNRDMQDRIRELEEVRQRRQQRIIDQEAFQKLRDEKQAQREIELYGTWEDKDEAFDRMQEKNRSRLRLLNHRAQLIDKLYMNTLLVEETNDAEELAEGLHLKDSVKPNLQNPADIIDHASQQDLAKAREVADRFIKSELNSEFWQVILVIMDDILSKMRGEKIFDARIDTLLHGKTENELIALRTDIQNNRIGKGLGDDAYWEKVLEELAVSLAKSQSARHNEELLSKLGLDAAEARQAERDSAAQARKEAEEKRREAEEAERRRRQEIVKLDESHFRPRDEPYIGTTIDESQDRLARHKLRLEVLDKERERNAELVYFSSSPAAAAAKLKTPRRSARFGKDDDADEVDVLKFMSERDEIPLPREIQPWFARYEPRKPRYFNKVRTGYEWNKYNKTHYDKENPPPKVVQGYKFRLDYTELIDRSKAPTYKVLPYPEDPDYAILRFKAGPPYLDIAFKIVNREWRVRRKQGFFNSFERGILHLNFQLKKPRYRR